MKNKVNKKYFLLSLKREIPFVIFNLVVFSLSYLLPLGFNGGFKFDETSNLYYQQNLSTNYGFLVFMLAIYAVIIPVKTFNFLTKKKYIDSFYSLPIERKAISIINILVNIICILVPFTLVFFTGSIITLIFHPKVIYIYYVIVYLILIVSFILYFMFNSFFFTRANKIIDGAVTMIFANFVFLLVVAVLLLIFDEYRYETIKFLNIDGYELQSVSLPFMPFIKYGNYFNDMILSKYNYTNYYKYQILYNPIRHEPILSYDEWLSQTIGSFNPIYLIFLSIISITAIVLFFVLFNKRKPEQAEEVANSNFGLKTLSPVCFTLLTLLLCGEAGIIESWLLFGIVAIGYMGTTLLEIRTFKFPLYKILILVGMFTLTIIF